jgi:hypothetical protein
VETEIIGALSFFFMYGLKVLKRDYLKPTPERKEKVHSCPVPLPFSELWYSR